MERQLQGITSLVEEIAVENSCVGISESIGAATSRAEGSAQHAKALQVANDMAQRTRVLENEVARLLASLRLA
jgi:hypothetical protein